VRPERHVAAALDVGPGVDLIARWDDEPAQRPGHGDDARQRLHWPHEVRDPCHPRHERIGAEMYDRVHAFGEDDRSIAENTEFARHGQRGLIHVSERTHVSSFDVAFIDTASTVRFKMNYASKLHKNWDSRRLTIHNPLVLSFLQWEIARINFQR
jgi:hypothetical protein